MYIVDAHHIDISTENNHPIKKHMHRVLVKVNLFSSNPRLAIIQRKKSESLENS
ncbi:MAG: hypothetical protein WKF36_10840 [Candidatus Nitrosocosmicus sp.]